MFLGKLAASEDAHVLLYHIYHALHNTHMPAAAWLRRR